MSTGLKVYGVTTKAEFESFQKSSFKVFPSFIACSEDLCNAPESVAK
jgi:hypothetical protein